MAYVYMGPGRPAERVGCSAGDDFSCGMQDRSYCPTLGRMELKFSSEELRFDGCLGSQDPIESVVISVKPKGCGPPFEKSSTISNRRASELGSKHIYDVL